MNTPVRNRSEDLRRLADLAPHLKSRGVTSLRVFGSAGRNAMTDESDVDILVEFDRPMGAFEFLDLQDDLAQTLGRPVDLVTPAAVKERMRARIECEGVDAVLQAPEADEFAGLVAQARAIARDEGLRVADVRRAVREAQRKA